MDRKQLLEEIKQLKGMDFEELGRFELNYGLRDTDFKKYSNLYDTLVVSSLTKLLKKRFGDELLISVFHERIGQVFTEKLDDVDKKILKELSSHHLQPTPDLPKENIPISIVRLRLMI